jgi:hypothetical protein
MLGKIGRDLMASEKTEPPGSELPAGMVGTGWLEAKGAKRIKRGITSK